MTIRWKSPILLAPLTMGHNAMIQINKVHAKEEGTIYFTVGFKDKDGSAVTPDSITWTITDTSGTVINNRSAVAVATPAASQTIRASGDDLSILSNEESKLVERRFTIKAMLPDGGDSVPHNEVARFWVENLTAITIW